MNTPRSLSNSRHGQACAAFEPLLPLAAHDLLDPEEGRTLQAHLADCAHCRARLAAYDRLDAALRLRFDQGASTSLLTEDMMQEIEHKEHEEREAPVPQRPQRAAARPRRVLSWVSAIAAVLVIGLVATALIASHPSTGTKTTPTEPGVSSAPGLYYSAVTTSSPPQEFIYALNPTTGALRWQTKVPANLSIGLENVDQGVLYVSAYDPSQLPGKDATPATHASGPDQSAIYAFRTSDGKQLWRRPTSGAPGPFRIGADGVLYVGNNAGVLFALRASDGSVLWHIPLDTLLDIKGEVNGVLYVSTVKTIGPGKLLALNASDGSTKWSFPIQGYATNANVLGDVIAVVDTTTVAGKDGVPDTSHLLTVLNASDGSVKWQYQGNPATVGNSVAGQDTFYVTLMSGTGKEQTAVTLQALNMSDGSLRWQKSYTNFSLLSELGNGKAYVTVNNDTIVALNEQDGSVAWQAQPGPLYIDDLLGGGLVSGTLYAQVGTTLYAFNADSGAVLWKVSSGEGGLISGTSNQVIYELVKPTNSQETWYLRLIAIDGATGQTLWHKDLNPSFSSMLAA